MKANIVCGTQWGDEGKGRVVSWLIDRNQTTKIVVRYSGGHQAGHTVIHNGIKHIFSNYGSGCLQNVDTYFSEYCTVYPNTLYNECKVLESKTNRRHVVYVHPLTMITTPYDVIYNRVTEMKNRHGSVGLGVGSTMKRNIETPYKLYAIDILYPELFKEKLKQIQRYYINILGGLEFSNLCVSKLGDLDFKREIEKFYSVFNENIAIEDYSFLSMYEEVIFEGSQGIMLDMDHGIFPNVTYGNTTTKNAINICEKIGIDNIENYYVTRCYQTRHGNGWMCNEGNVELVNNHEEINVSNHWQGNFRVGEFDLRLLNHAYLIDKIYNPNINNDNLVVTCVDQRPELNFKEQYGEIIRNHTTITNIYESFSPNTQDIRKNCFYDRQF